MNVSVYAHIKETTKIYVRFHESQDGKFCTFTAGDLSVIIRDREKLLEIASLLENSAQKWED